MPSYGSLNQVKGLNERNKTVKPYLKSTGAKTAQGKRKVSRNAKKHFELKKSNFRGFIRRTNSALKLIDRINQLQNKGIVISKITMELVEEYLCEYDPPSSEYIRIGKGKRIRNYLQ